MGTAVQIQNIFEGCFPATFSSRWFEADEADTQQEQAQLTMEGNEIYTLIS